MREYWERCLAEDWPRIRSLLEQDVLYRARQIADGGTARLFCDLDPSVGWEEGVLHVECGDKCETILNLDERGLLMIPERFRVAQGHDRDGPAVAADAGLSRARDRDALEPRAPRTAGCAREAPGTHARVAADGTGLAALDHGARRGAGGHQRRRLPASGDPARRGPRKRAPGRSGRCSTCARRRAMPSWTPQGGSRDARRGAARAPLLPAPGRPDSAGRWRSSRR